MGDIHTCRVRLMQWQVDCLQWEIWTGFFRTWTSTASGLLSSEILWVEHKSRPRAAFSNLTQDPGRLVDFVCFRRTVSRLSFWLLPSFTSSLSSWCPSIATSWSPTMTRNTRSGHSRPGAQVSIRKRREPLLWKWSTLFVSIICDYSYSIPILWSLITFPHRCI